MAKLTQQECCDKASKELRDILEKYHVMVAVDDDFDPPYIYLTPKETDEFDFLARLH